MSETTTELLAGASVATDGAIRAVLRGDAAAARHAIAVARALLARADGHLTPHAPPPPTLSP